MVSEEADRVVCSYKNVLLAIQRWSSHLIELIDITIARHDRPLESRGVVDPRSRGFLGCGWLLEGGGRRRSSQRRERGAVRGCCCFRVPQAAGSGGGGGDAVPCTAEARASASH